MKRTPVKIYALYDYRTKFVFYIGFAKNPSIEAHKTQAFSLRTRVDQYVFSMMLDDVEIGLIELGKGFAEDAERWIRKFPNVLNNRPLEPGKIGTAELIRKRFEREFGKDAVDKILLHMGY